LLQGAFSPYRIVSLTLDNGTTGILAIFYALVAPVLVAILEEVSFRGILQGRLEAAIGAGAAGLIAGTIFVASHGWKPGFFSQIGFYISLALVTGLSAARTISLLPALAIHIIANLFSAIVPLVNGPLNLARMPRGVIPWVAIAGTIAAIGAGWNLNGFEKSS
jgi:membrane protease YdiL (CAAX protease family)